MSQGVLNKPNAFYHIYLAGNRDQTLFDSSDDYKNFLQLYSKVVAPMFDTCAYCLLPDHFHFFVRLWGVRSQIIAWETKGNSAEAFVVPNPQQSLDQLLFEALGLNLPLNIVEVPQPQQFPHLIRYIHQNPAHHGHVSNFRDWRWSSYHAFLSDKPTRVATKMAMRWFHNIEWFEELHWETQDVSQLGYLIVED